MSDDHSFATLPRVLKRGTTSGDVDIPAFFSLDEISHQANRILTDRPKVLPHVR